MKTIAFINQKGGCGKTTCSINTAACLAQLGQRTLLVDMDPQGHCAVGLAVPDAQIQAGVYDVLRDPVRGKTIKEITWQIAANFDLAPSTISLVALESELHGLAGRQDRLADALIKVEKDYDFCIIDCPPNVGLLTFNAMRAAQEVIIPVETGFFSLHGLAKQLELIDSLRKQIKSDVQVRILATLYDIRTKLAREVLAELREQFADMLMDSTINFNTKLKEAASFGQPITEYDPASKGFKDFLRLAKEVMGPVARITLDSSRLPMTTPATTLVEENDEELALDLDDVPTERAPLDRLPALSAIRRPTPTPVVAQPVLAGRGLGQQAGDLARKAETILSQARSELGLALASNSVSTTQSKLEEIYGVRQLPEGVLFVAKLPLAKRVGIAGDFNGWSPDATHMLPADSDTFRTVLVLPPGRYRYRLVVDGHWQPDPHNRNTEPNPFGGVNSVVEVA